MFSIKSWWLTRFSIVGPGCRSRVRMYLLGHPDAYSDDEDLIAKWYAHVNSKPLPLLTTLPFPARAFTVLVREGRKA
jgi:hypothetical protein